MGNGLSRSCHQAESNNPTLIIFESVSSIRCPSLETLEKELQILSTKAAIFLLSCHCRINVAD